MNLDDFLKGFKTDNNYKQGQSVFEKDAEDKVKATAWLKNKYPGLFPNWSKSKQN